MIPAIVAPIAVVVAAIAVPSIAYSASPPPDKTPAQVLTLIAGSHDAHYFGTVQQTSDLGLPPLPTSMAPDSSSQGLDAVSLVALVTGSHSAQVYVDGQSKQRVQILDTLSERDLIHNDTSVWTYDAKARTATHLTASPHEPNAQTDQALTPAAMADGFIASITPTTSLTVSTDTFHGRGVYELTFEPRTSATLVGNAVVTVDAETGVPLGVHVTPRGQTASAFSMAFTSIDFSRPDSSVFSFTPPTGTTVHDLTPPADGSNSMHPGNGDVTAPTVTGSGWESVVEVAAGTGTSATTDQTPRDLSLLNELTQSVSGGRMLRTSLFTVYLRDDGTVFAGAVPASTLLATAK
ncbi:sigma-E factor regulatory protein RseB domain-containing protein [Microbacterium deminutum]|uniref:Sigma-E factor regulatory protein RseB domain-containing protein n=1 Tax=Microbacterium deminutum TaxID=344164 RepID=A0ABN2REK2_9MICO